MSTSDKDIGGEGSETKRLVQEIEDTRVQMSGTIAALEQRLNPADLRGKLDSELQHVEEKVRVVVREHLAEAKVLVKEELSEAKTLLRGEIDEVETRLKTGLAEARTAVKKDLAAEVENAEAKIRKGLSDAKESVKKDLQEAVTGARQSVRAATLGRVEDLATDIGDSMNRTKDSLVDTIRQNPLPAAIAGIGIAWLFMNRSSGSSNNARRETFVDPRGNPYGGGGRSITQGGREAFASAQHAVGGAIDDVGSALHHAGDATGRAVHQATDAAGNALHSASDAAGNALHQMTDAAGNLLHQAADATGAAAGQATHMAGAFAHGAYDASANLVHGAGHAVASVATGAASQARRVEKSFQTTLQTNPLAIGAAALAVGAIVGFALPHTDQEDRLMGDVRDDLLQRAEGLAEQAVDAVGSFSGDTLGRAQSLLGEGGGEDKEKKGSSTASA